MKTNVKREEIETIKTISLESDKIIDVDFGWVEDKKEESKQVKRKKERYLFSSFELKMISIIMALCGIIPSGENDNWILAGAIWVAAYFTYCLSKKLKRRGF